MARLSTHVLDTSRGEPAAGIVIELHRLRGGERHAVANAMTIADGRTDPPLLTGDSLDTGVYELVFHAGRYFRQSGLTLPAPPFLDEIVIRIGIADADGSYHVPLLLSPYGYSTYKGS
jgi:5-hydroxyisourate hydrolase